MPISTRPPLITSAVAATFARYAGLRYAMQVHICPSRTREVLAA
jgi:hypothetical protein